MQALLSCKKWLKRVLVVHVWKLFIKKNYMKNHKKKILNNAEEKKII